MTPIRVLVADDHTLVRESLVNVLDASGECKVVAQAADGMSAVEKALQMRPDVAIVDISMPGLNGIEVVRRLHAELPQTRTLVLMPSFAPISLLVRPSTIMWKTSRSREVSRPYGSPPEPSGLCTCCASTRAAAAPKCALPACSDFTAPISSEIGLSLSR
jgi:hypothetical protein